MSKVLREVLWIFISFYLITASNLLIGIYFGSHTENTGLAFLLIMWAILLMILNRYIKGMDLSKKKLLVISGMMALIFFTFVIWNVTWGSNYKWNGHGFTDLAKEDAKQRLNQELLPFDSLIRINPQSDTPYYKKGVFLQGRYEYLASTEELKKAIAINPHNVDASFQCARSYELMKDTANAIKYYKLMLETDTGNAYVKGYIKILTAKYHRG